MTNEEKYRTVEARREAFNKYCKDRSCKSCGLSNSNGLLECSFQWLAAEAEPSIADIVAAMRTRSEYTREEWKALCDSLDAAAKRAYERIYSEMNKGVVYGESRPRELHSVLDETIGVLSYHRR